MKKSRVWPALPLFQAHKPSHKTPFKSGKHPGTARRNSLLPSLCPGQTSLLNRMKKSIKGLAGNCSRHTNQATRHPSNQENTLPWRGVTKQPPAVPLPGPNVTPEPNEKIKGLAGNCSRHTNQATRHPSNQENTLARRDETASRRPSANATPERNEKSRFWQEFHCWGTELHCSLHRNLCSEDQRHFELGCWQAIPLDTLQIRKTPWHGVTKQPSLCRGQTSLLNRMKNQGSGRQLFQAHKTSHKTPFKSGKHPGTA